MTSSWELTNTYLSLALLITSIALYLGGGWHNTGITSQTCHRQYALQRHGIWWCPCLENEPPTSNAIFSYSNLQYFCLKLYENEIIWTPGVSPRHPPLDPSMLVVVQAFAQEKDVTILKCTHTMYSLQILFLPVISTCGWYQLQLLTNYV